ncbi:hypothetical protein HCU67_12740 [Muricauda sp. DJ-13]|uniref:DUF5683 domain-containing protein n=2 Tax=Croceivirga thetidis TaxID=2721623 RepID=A0ABX1GUT6_9FLAO|nr:DUF5683 domain-containing protein [Croceivirga thetidis]NKI32816.1 hypothetical protein [Croceivirga thetidis]
MVSAQVQDSIPDKGADSIRTDLKRRGIVIQDGQLEKKEINPLAPAKAAFLSAILPGMGQVYNKRYWKVPLVWGAMGAAIYGYSINNTQYNRVRDAFKKRQAGLPEEFSDGIVPDLSTDALQDSQERFQRDRDLMLLLTIGAYALNIIDANVDAHLKQYNVDDRLGIDFKPFIDYNEMTAQPYYGLAFQVKF